MKNQFLRKWKIIAVVFAILAVVLLATMIVMLMGADWKIFSLRPLWLFFLLLMLCGLSLISVTVACMRAAAIRAHMENTVLCPACQAECDCEDVFCHRCGVKLQIEENE